MEVNKVQRYIKSIVENMPPNWLNLTTHRLDIYEEELAKVQFLEQYEALFRNNNSNREALNGLPTAYDYIRLGHPLSCVLEWVIAKANNIDPKSVISFSSSTIAILAILRKNLLDNIDTRIIYTEKLPNFFDIDVLRSVYGYRFEVVELSSFVENSVFDGSTILISHQKMDTTKDLGLLQVERKQNIDFYITIHSNIGGIVLVNGKQNESYISDIQHVRRRETIAMTPDSCLTALKKIAGKAIILEGQERNTANNKAFVLNTIKEITGASSQAIIGSSGLSIQYAILMGLIHDAVVNHPTKAIKIIVPPNCYGGTNDQCRRVAASNKNIEVLDLAVDDGHDMVQSIDIILDQLAQEDAIPLIIAEIPTNPRVEVPDLQKLRKVLSKRRTTPSGTEATEPVFILDQTFCPNVHFLGQNDILSSVKTISYVSGSKFPSGGLCTAGYCVANDKAQEYLPKIERHLEICGNEATPLQIEILAKQMPSMIRRIEQAYNNTREFTGFISRSLPDSKINFVSDELAEHGFTPSVFSLDLPTKGNSPEEKESYKRALNHKLIKLMITAIPNESKHCVSYGQLKGSYWTIPATSTQGTTKEGDKDYIVRVALSPDMDIELHKNVFSDFVENR